MNRGFFPVTMCYQNKSSTMEAILLFLGGVGVQEMIVIGLVILVFFGAKKIPEFMKGMGKGVKEFKEGLKETTRDLEETEEKKAER
jgi:sec-independent protein translocase protein TatA